MRSGYRRFVSGRSGPVWLFLVVAAVLLDPQSLPAARAPAKSAPESRQTSQAIVTLVEGKALLRKSPKHLQELRVGDQVTDGAWMRLGKSARLILLWDNCVVAVIQAPAKEISLALRSPAPESMSGKARAVATNVWRAVSSKLSGLCRGRDQGGQLTQGPTGAPLPRAPMPVPSRVVTRPRGIWALNPKSERIRPGDLMLRWEASTETAGPYEVSIWDSTGGRTWGTKTTEREFLVPHHAFQEQGHPYRWRVEGADRQAIAGWVQTLTEEQLALLDAQLRRVRGLFAGVDPHSQLHLAIGCVLERHGLLTEARAEYQEAAKLSPQVHDYEELASQKRSLPPPAAQPATQRGE